MKTFKSCASGAGTPRRARHQEVSPGASATSGRLALAVAELQAAERAIVKASDALPRVLAIARRAEQIDATDAFPQITCGAESLAGGPRPRSQARSVTALRATHRPRGSVARMAGKPIGDRAAIRP